MISRLPFRCRLVLLCAAATVGIAPAGAAADRPTALPPQVTFNRDIRPILSDNCFSCHGPDEKQRKGDLRFDLRAGAVADRGGYSAIVPGDVEQSELWRRITSLDEAERMPPRSKKTKPLSLRDQALIQRWIEQGAEYQQHWSFLPVAGPELPAVVQRDWPRGGIDYFVLARLEQAGLAPSPPANRRTLIRRVTRDLTGLPPTADEVRAFLADGSPDAYEKLVDRLLQSPRFGERMTMQWLDLARYADTHGYHEDYHRDMWPWRDWVIDAFNTNMPFDQFTIEQLAGDLLPGSTARQKVATGFNRNHGVTASGISEEYRVEYVIDRVKTTSTVWMGLTVGCAQCHDHKYDPISQEEFYRFFAYFNTITDKGVENRSGNVDPQMPILPPAEEQQLLDLQARIAEFERSRKARPEAVDKGRRDDELLELEEQVKLLLDRNPSVMVMREMPVPRDTFILQRGLYDRPGRKVEAGTPTTLAGLPRGAEANRLGMARWLVDPSHPLTGRVAVNRFWQMFFGTGIVKTSEDFGTQGEWPSHPELLDWLAARFVDDGWDVKTLLRLIATSAVYRQDSTFSPALFARDPENRLLARGPRYRLPAEMIRDNALMMGGLLVEQTGGPSVRPYQPPGLWAEMSNRGYEQDHGENLYRRSIYTYWKRAVPPPNMLAMDAPTRETCTVRRQRTNTPLQALVTLNDPTYVEAARALAARMMTEAGSTPENAIRFAFLAATARHPRSVELNVLLDVFAQELPVYRADASAAQELLAVGESPVDPRLDTAQLAAWTSVARIILNLDEVISKE